MEEQIPEAQPSDVRSQRGLALAHEKREAIKPLVGTKYLVPSAADNGSTYVVDASPKVESCSCLDWSKLGGYDRPHRCKHLWAVIHVLKLADGSELLMTEKPDAPDEPKKTYQRHCSWKTINACRTLIPRLAPMFIEDLVDGSGLFGPKPRGRGAPAIPEADIVKAALLREFAQAPAGTAQVIVEDYYKAGTVHMTKVPAYNTLLERFADPGLMPKLHRLLAGSALILLPFGTGFAVDGTGFGTSVYDHYYVEKHGKKAQKRRPTKRSRWIDAKIVYEVRTHVIPAMQPTEQHAIGGEPGVMPELLRRTIANGGHVTEWYGDAAYCTEGCAAAVEEVGAAFYVDWIRGRTGKTKKAALLRLHEKFKADKDLYWSHYDKGRPLAETGNMMLKTRFGHSLKSRNADTQYAEVMLRCICHNIACLVMAVQELGVEPKYWTRDLSELPDFGTTAPRMIEAATTIEVK